MYVRVYHNLPEEACYIREEVFVAEQGFTDEFDKLDLCAAHLVLFTEEEPAAVCRVYQENDRYILGRVAVLKAFRGKGLGAAIIRVAEEHVRRQGGQELHLHAQCRITGFYEAIGYTQYGPIEDDQGCPHIWMMKNL